MRVCWNRQTGKLEVLVPVRACEFKSHYPHHGSPSNKHDWGKITG